MSTFSNKHIPGDPFTPNPSDWKHADTAKHYAEEAGLYATQAKNYSDQLENNVTVLNEHIAELDEHASEIMRTVDESMDEIQSAVEASAESAEAAAASAEEAADIVSGVQDYVDRAEAAATGAESARDSAQLATTLAIAAKDSASLHATAAQGYASGAQDAATDSAASATTASDAATSAQGYATAASTSSATSAQFAADAQGYANEASDSADSAGTYAQMAASSSASAAASATSASEAVERVVEVIPAFVGTMQEWDDLPQEEKDKCDEKIVRITDDNISNVCSTVQECEDSESSYDVSGASALVELKDGVHTKLSGNADWLSSDEFYNKDTSDTIIGYWSNASTSTTNPRVCSTRLYLEAGTYTVNFTYSSIVNFYVEKLSSASMEVLVGLNVTGGNVDATFTINERTLIAFQMNGSSDYTEEMVESLISVISVFKGKSNVKLTQDLADIKTVIKSKTNATNTQLVLDYPKGFNYSNTIVLRIGILINGYIYWYDNTDSLYCCTTSTNILVIANVSAFYNKDIYIVLSKM